MTSERDNCGLSSILPISCRDRAEAFARSLQSKLSSLRGHDSPNNERSWLGPHDRPVTLSQPLQNSTSTDRFYDLEQELDSPQSPQDEIEAREFHVLINKDNLKVNGDCHCPKFEEEENTRQAQFFVKTNGLTKCTSNDSVNSEIFYDLDDDPPNSANYINGLKNSESSKSFSSELNSQATLSSNQSEAYCTSLDCTPQPSLSEDLSTLSIQKISNSSSTSDLNGLSDRSSSDDTGNLSSSDDLSRVNGCGIAESGKNLNDNNHTNQTVINEVINTNGCREELNIENLILVHNEFEANNTENHETKSEEEHRPECLECKEGRKNYFRCEHSVNFRCEKFTENYINVQTDLDIRDDKSITTNLEDYNTENKHIENDKNTILNGKDYNNEHNSENEKDCEKNKLDEKIGEDLLEIESIDETDFKVIGNGDGYIQSEILVSRTDIDVRLPVECGSTDVGKEKITNDTEEANESTIKIVIKDDNTGDEDDDDSDDENVTPRLRRCSSLKTGKTPPGTPGRKKIVRFADVLGLDLADVRTFLDEIPKVPKSAYDDLSDVDITDSSDSGDLLTSGGNKFHGIKIDRILVPMFEQPAMLPNFLDLVRDFQVCLENAFVDDPVLFSIRGFVRVRNLDFHKSVHIRYSLDSWATFSDVQGTYLSNSCDGFSDKFSFIIYANTLQVGQRIELACRFQCKGCQYWDNNQGKNYVFQCLPAANSVACPQTVVRGVHTHDDWGASFY